MIIVDSREKKWAHIQNYLERHSIPYTVRKLDVGDYALEDHPELVIDRKRDLNELAVNLCSKDSWRFWRELRRAHDNNIKVIFLIEEKGCESVKDVLDWKSEYARVSGKNLYNEMFRATCAYGTEWKFCSKSKTPAVILELLNYDNR